MIYKCPNCNGALEYNPTSDKMECAFCGNAYSVGEISTTQVGKDYVDFRLKEFEQETDSKLEQSGQENGFNDLSTEEEDVFVPLGTMECKIYTCTSCGAQLVVNDTEAATFCAYCGQPTIVFSRISEELKPESIIPFNINKERAIRSIRNIMERSAFVPDEVKKSKIEQVRGIYIPYWVYDIRYYDWKYHETVDLDGNSDGRTLRASEYMHMDITLDASSTLDDELSQRLEPYNLRGRKPFEAGYLSGYYMDKYDISANQLHKYAPIRAKELLEVELNTAGYHNANKNALHAYWSYEPQIVKAEYSLFPAWFMTFRYNYEPYTIMINGQNGKIIGTLPYDKKKIIGMLIVLSVIASVIVTILSYVFYNCFDLVDDAYKILLAAFSAVVPAVLYFKAFSILRQVRAAKYMTTNRITSQYVRERQDKM